jgi:DNA topoisomerase-1
VRFRVRGKSGVVHEVGVSDRRLAALVRRCQGLPGQQLFQYVDQSGETREIDSEDVNEYIRRIAGDDAFSAKDVRTWSATVLAYRALQSADASAKPAEARRAVAGAVRATADRLGNTPTVARQSYVHPAILESYLEAGEARGAAAAPDSKPARAASAPPRRRRVSPEAPPTPAEEAAVLELLRARAADARASKRRGATRRPAEPARHQSASRTTPARASR